MQLSLVLRLLTLLIEFFNLCALPQKIIGRQLYEFLGILKAQLNMTFFFVRVFSLSFMHILKPNGYRILMIATLSTNLLFILALTKPVGILANNVL